MAVGGGGDGDSEGDVDGLGGSGTVIAVDSLAASVAAWLRLHPALSRSNGGNTVVEDPSPLQSKDHRDLLDVADRLRSQGFGRFVDLPQIIVCGDQSSGKSLALEAISGMSFPAKDNPCTRFATELILRRAPKDEDGVDICIIPGAERTDGEKAGLRGLSYSGTVADLDLGKVVEDAKAALGLNGNVKVFGMDILRVEISGPSRPHLTMVDLPGPFIASNKDQSEDHVKVVEPVALPC
ncbi:hypothetical protein VTK26DRAFT_4614 [Humicola hyalothermophila]